MLSHLVKAVKLGPQVLVRGDSVVPYLTLVSFVCLEYSSSRVTVD